LLTQIQSYIRTAASRDRLTARIGPFLATVNPNEPLIYFNYAIPDDGAQPTPAEVAALVEFYRQNERTPRLEYMPALAPELEQVLHAQGFVVERSVPFMIYDAALPRTMTLKPGIDLLRPMSDEDFMGMAGAQTEAFGGDESPPDASAVEPGRQFLAAGGISVVARDAVSGEIVGAGVCDVPFDHTTELAGVGVRATYRRRGIAAAMTAWLVDAALAAGTTTIFLTAAGEDEARVYGRAGFRTISETVHISQP
jgi:ribosomal protein S18 acetylase RimI-like enzyme